MDLLLPLIPENIPVTLLEDGEFDGIGLQQMCTKIGWNYVLRTAYNTIPFEKNQCFKAKDISPDEQQCCAFIPTVEFTELRFRYVNFVCWHDVTRHEDPIFLVSHEVMGLISRFSRNNGLPIGFQKNQKDSAILK